MGLRVVIAPASNEIKIYKELDEVTVELLSRIPIPRKQLTNREFRDLIVKILNDVGLNAR